MQDRALRGRRRDGHGQAAARAHDTSNSERIFGKHSVRAVLLTRPKAVRRVVVLPGKDAVIDEIRGLSEAAGIHPEVLSMDEFLHAARFTSEERQFRHQGVFAIAKPRTIYTEHDLDLLAAAGNVLALDQVSNPQNLGAILRNAAFFGADAVLLLKNRSANVTPSVVRIAVGGAEYVKIFKVINLARSLDKLRDLGFAVYGLDERGELTLDEVKFESKNVLVLGAEGEGLRERTKKFSDRLVRIPAGRPGVESLNVAVAAAVALSRLPASRGIS
jgi:23S rRNA (guanosine2251-2'-O)-methyltransferase